jgi:hypothetical protein
MIGGANRDGPDLSWKVWVTEPRHGAEQVRRETRALFAELRPGWTLKNASGMTSTRWRTAAHGATGRFSHDSRGMRALAPPRRLGVLNKSLGFERPPSKAPGLVRSWRERDGRISLA